MSIGVKILATASWALWGICLAVDRWYLVPRHKRKVAELRRAIGRKDWTRAVAWTPNSLHPETRIGISAQTDDEAIQILIGAADNPPHPRPHD